MMAVEESDREGGRLHGVPQASQAYHPEHRCEPQQLRDPARVCGQGSSKSHVSQHSTDPFSSSLTRYFRKYPVSIKCFY